MSLNERWELLFPNGGINKAFSGFFFFRGSQKEKKKREWETQSLNKLGDFWNPEYVVGRENGKYLCVIESKCVK